MKSFILLFLVCLTFTNFSFAASHTICKTPTEDKHFRLIENQLVMSFGEPESSRMPSNHVAIEVNVTNEKLHQKFNQDGLNYVFHIENTKKPSEIDDYLMIENHKGQKVVYPIHCI